MGLDEAGFKKGQRVKYKKGNVHYWVWDDAPGGNIAVRCITDNRMYAADPKKLVRIDKNGTPLHEARAQEEAEKTVKRLIKRLKGYHIDGNARHMRTTAEQFAINNVHVGDLYHNTKPINLAKEEKKMNRNIVKAFPNTEDAVLVEEILGGDIGQDFLTGLVLKDKADEVLAEAKRIKAEREGK